MSSGRMLSLRAANIDLVVPPSASFQDVDEALFYAVNYGLGNVISGSYASIRILHSASGAGNGEPDSEDRGNFGNLDQLFFGRRWRLTPFTGSRRR
jgi:hypothetical protein